MAIPVFFDVGIIILFPIVKALAAKSGKNVLHYALPLLTGLAITHSFIPPTPGPVAVAEILNVDLGYAIVVGALIGLPISLICGLVLSKLITPKTTQEIAPLQDTEDKFDNKLVKTIFFILGLPIILILVGSFLKILAGEGIIENGIIVETISFIGHPFVSLIIATVLAMYFLGTKRGATKAELFDVANKSLGPAGSIILITGAGGVLKQMMINTGIGDMIGKAMESGTISIVILAYLVAVLVRIMQGSATVAMLTAAGIVAAVIPGMDLTMLDKTLIMMAIAAGSIVLSHVNDSGFWLVNRYLDHTVQQTLRSWTIQSSMISVSSFLLIFLAYQIL